MTIVPLLFCGVGYGLSISGDSSSPALGIFGPVKLRNSGFPDNAASPGEPCGDDRSSPAARLRGDAGLLSIFSGPRHERYSLVADLYGGPFPDEIKVNRYSRARRSNQDAG